MEQRSRTSSLSHFLHENNCKEKQYYLEVSKMILVDVFNVQMIVQVKDLKHVFSCFICFVNIRYALVNV